MTCGSSAAARGFTLIELLVSLAVAMVLIWVSILTLRQAADSYERVGGGIRVEREARAVLSQLTVDLATAQPHLDSRFLRSDGPWPADRLGFLALKPADAQSLEGRSGDLCAVHYYLQDLTIAGKSVRCLMRGFRESRDTFRSLQEDSIKDLFAPTLRDEPVAFQVVSFRARPLRADGSGGWEELTQDNPLPPQAVDVQLVIARRELAGKLTTAADWNGEGQWGKMLGSPAGLADHAHLEVFGSIIRFGNDASLQP